MNLLKTVEKYRNDLLMLNFYGFNKKSIPDYIKGSIRTCEAQTLYSIIRENKYKNIIDIGTGPGFSAMYFAQALKDEHIEDGKVETIDITLNEVPVNLINKFDLNDFVSFNNGSSTDILPSFKFRSDVQYWDFVLIDGEHSYEQSKIDFENAYELIRTGGCIAFHDVYPRPANSPGVRDFIDTIPITMGEIIFFKQEIFDFFNYDEDVQDYLRISQKWAHYNYSYVDRLLANAKELMAVFFKK
tara:strand:- start:6749 stop:7477 length:729 start_codon:yes stop_codon:yes gene_type:complete